MAGSQMESSELSSEGCHVALTAEPLNVQRTMDRVRSPEAGAIVLFAGEPPPTPMTISAQSSAHSHRPGTTRDSFAGQPVKELAYTAYTQLALRTMLAIGSDVRARHGLKGIAMAHRLGTVPIGEESILIAVSAPHRQAAWRAGEEALEACKARVEVWKREEFHGGHGVWRANRDGVAGEKVDS
ncbi:Molybdenum cofactor synthesis protein 2B [Ophiocordyceps sinensis CO18]|uniref:Molybdopterin synthase catalytic subunit n=1 Tax=Ophiocordyceps sinensis (strain Co18 / CGMCC 3.14243) TaxID=911162 RepID=T5AB16_OPHSC|nr:Molybdenum cofactor synthesis protein 2B [Ophiocordyceps sinensis CO18]